MKKKIFTKDNLIFFLILNLGLIFTAVGISIFKTPNHFAFGGTSGLSIILSTLFPQWNVGVFMWIVKAVLVCWDFSSWESIPWAGPFIPPLPCPFLSVPVNLFTHYRHH